MGTSLGPKYIPYEAQFKRRQGGGEQGFHRKLSTIIGAGEC